MNIAIVEILSTTMIFVCLSSHLSSVKFCVKDIV